MSKASRYFKARNLATIIALRGHGFRKKHCSLRIYRAFRREFEIYEKSLCSKLRRKYRRYGKNAGNKRNKRNASALLSETEETPRWSVSP